MKPKGTYGVLDTETQIFKKGHPFAQQNRLCLVGIRTGGSNYIWKIEYDSDPYAKALADIQSTIDSVSILVLFNGKFDLHWLRRYGIKFEHKLVWDCQLAEFILGNQLNRFPSLAGTSTRLGLPSKGNDFAAKYWDKGIDTPNIPLRELIPYLEGDLEDTEQVYLKQLVEVEQAGKMDLVKLHNADLLVLEEMEANGIQFNWEGMVSRSQELHQKLDDTIAKLQTYCSSWSHFNWASGDHLSCLLYGGTINVDEPTPYEHTYLSGPKRGTTETRNKWQVVSRTYPRLVEPIEGSSLKKDGYWSTDEGTLKQLKGVTELVDLLLAKAEYTKLLSTYYDGIPKLFEEYDWEPGGAVHGQLNQVTVVTGRLSAEKPNQQNFVAEINDYIISRFLN